MKTTSLAIQVLLALSVSATVMAAGPGEGKFDEKDPRIRELKKLAWRRNPWAEELPTLEDIRNLPTADLPGVARTGW